MPIALLPFRSVDVALVLTCLSYYYQGLTSLQLVNCFNLLFKQDDAAVEYEVRSNFVHRAIYS